MFCSYLFEVGINRYNQISVINVQGLEAARLIEGSVEV